mgnify:CR=1 FL=1|jgi:hypothetical protein
MSHIPLLARSTVPKLQSPRRAPQVLCACLLVGIVLLVMTPRAAFEAIPWNATRAAPDPPPDAVRRIIEFAERQPYMHRFVGEETQQDLVATVGYLAKRELGSR